MTSSGYQYSFGNAGFRQRRPPTPVELVNAYRDAVYYCTNLNACSVASTPFRLYAAAPRSRSSSGKSITRHFGCKDLSHAQRRHLASVPSHAKKLSSAEKTVELTEHPVLDLFEDVNPWFDKFSFFQLVSAYLDVLGAAYVTFARGALGRITELWPLPSWMVTPSPDYEGDQVIKEYVYTAGGSHVNVTLPADEVLYFRSLSLIDPYVTGYGPLRAGYLLTETFSKLQDLQDSLLDNRGRPDAILLPKEDVFISPEDAQRINGEFLQTFARSRSGGLYVAPGGMDLKPLSWSPKDMGELAEAKQALYDVARIFGIPIPLVDGSAANRANSDAALLQYARQVITPRHRQLEATINSNLLPSFDDRLFVAFDSATPADEAAQRENVKTYVTLGVMTRDEARAELGLPPIEGGDTALVSNGLVPLGHAATPPEDRIIPPLGPARPDDVPDDTRDPSQEFDEGEGADDPDQDDEPFREGDDLRSQTSASKSALAAIARRLRSEPGLDAETALGLIERVFAPRRGPDGRFAPASLADDIEEQDRREWEREAEAERRRQDALRRERERAGAEPAGLGGALAARPSRGTFFGD